MQGEGVRLSRGGGRNNSDVFDNMQQWRKPIFGVGLVAVFVLRVGDRGTGTHRYEERLLREQAALVRTIINWRYTAGSTTSYYRIVCPQQACLVALFA